MGRVIDLVAWRRSRGAPREGSGAIERLERAVVGLAPLVSRLEAKGRIERSVETELMAITGAVSIGLAEEAAERAERLLARLKHPSHPWHARHPWHPSLHLSG